MLVYHGSSVEVKTPDISYGRVKLDFGKGFYVTTLQKQAEKWSWRKAKLEKGKPTVSVYKFNVDSLSILAFDGYSEEWLDFVVRNRAEVLPPVPYDAIYGNIANDDVATVVNDYIRLLRRGRLSDTGKRFYLEQLQYSEPNNQYCITSQKGIDALQFSRSFVLGG